MAKMEDLASELINYVTDHLRQAGDLAAFARTSRRLYNVVDPVLYKFAKTKVDRRESWHPLRWAAENGQTGTLKKALVAGIDANLLFNATINKMTRDMQSFQIRVEAVDGKAIWDPPEWNPTEEWRPTDDDTDHNSLARTMFEKQRTENPTSRDYYHAMGLGIGDDGDSDSSDFTNEMDLFQTQIVGSGSWAIYEDSDEDDQDNSSVDSDQHDAVVRRFRALHLAARGGHDDAVQVLLEYGADIDLCSGELCNCESGYARSHAGGAGVLRPRTAVAGFSSLHLAICHFQASTAKLLLSQGASIQLSEPGRDYAATALHAAAATGQVDLCKHLLDHGYVSDVDVLDSSGLTPFYYAYFNGHWNTTVAFLLERGANIDFLVSDVQFEYLSSTILFEACAFGRYEDAMRLVHLGADVSKGQYNVAHDVQLLWPLHAACKLPETFEEPPRHPPLKLSAGAAKQAHKRVELIETMLRQGADTEVKSESVRASPLRNCVINGLGSALRSLLAAGADVESRDLYGTTLLMSTCMLHQLHQSEEEIARSLLDHGSQINATDNDGRTALHKLCGRSINPSDEPRRERMVRLLLERGAKESARDKLGLTPFETAFNKGNLRVCGTLLRRRRTVQPLQNEDLHRMLLATIHDRPTHEAMNLVLDLDLDEFLYTKSDYIMNMVGGGHVGLACTYLGRRTSMPPLSPEEKMTILHKAIELGVLVLAEFMLALRVSVNSVNKNGHTPLYAIISRTGKKTYGISRTGKTWGKEDFVKALLNAGADIHFRPSAGSLMTPLEKAIVSREQSLVKLMLRSQSLRSDSQAVLPPLRLKGVYLHAAARTCPSKRMFSALIRSGASVTELDSNGDYPLSVFLKSLMDEPGWMLHRQGAVSVVCGTIWYLWSRDVDINRKNKAGKSILNYLTALRLYNGLDPGRVTIARELRRYIAIVPVKGPHGAMGDKALEFRHGPVGFGAVDDDPDE